MRDVHARTNTERWGEGRRRPLESGEKKCVRR